jgi:hypothetical protein
LPSWRRWDTEGNGIYEHDTGLQIFDHNLVGCSTGSGFCLRGKATDRRMGGMEMVYGLHQVRNNLLCQNAVTNVFGGQPCTNVGNLSEGFTAAFDPATLELTLSATNRFPRCELAPLVGRDFFDKPRKGPATAAGPFAQMPAQTIRIKLWRVENPSPASLGLGFAPDRN